MLIETRLGVRLWRLVKLTRVSPRTLRSEQANADGQSVMQLAASHLEHLCQFI